MILTIDIGNSNIAFATFKENKIINKWRIITDKKKSSNEYSVVIQQLLKADEINFGDIEGIVMSSVVPEITLALKESLSFLKAKILIIGDSDVKTNLNIKPELKSEVGADILMNIVAAKKLIKENFIIIDMGTATTFDIVVKNGEYIGSIITIGANLAASSLHKKCSKLPLIEIKKPNNIIGNNTTEALKTGLYYGYIGLIKEIIEQIKQRFKDINFKILLTGGLTPVFVHDLKFIDIVSPDLSLEGLNEVWNLNK